MKCLIQAVSLWMSLPLMADPQLPAKPLSPPPVAASSSAATGAPLATDSSVSGKISFVGGTSILTKEGRKSAADIIAGDRVWATDITTHKGAYHMVTHVSSGNSSNLIQLLTDTHEKIESSPASLFWVNTKGWIEARSLFPGEQLLQKDGTFAHVFNVIPMRAQETKVAYKGVQSGQYGPIARAASYTLSSIIPNVFKIGQLWSTGPTAAVRLYAHRLASFLAD